MIDGVHIWRAHLEGPSRPVLRRVLGRYLDAEPDDGDLEVGERGKPRLRTGEGIEFNLSHSQNLALVAVAGRPVGIDVELIRPRRDLLRLADRALAPAEAAAIRSAAPREQIGRFYRSWVRHEARVKCLGTGLGATASAASVAVEEVEVAPGYVAAVAVLGDEVGPIDCRTLRPG
jgi:4'-phosphopantetheinyl transferase